MEWKKPRITRVELNSEQAVLKVCVQDYEGFGAWMDVFGTTMCTFGLNPGKDQCNINPRGSFGYHDHKFDDPQNAGSSFVISAPGLSPRFADQRSLLRLTARDRTESAGSGS